MTHTEATKGTEMDRCGAACQERTGWGFFYRCKNAAKVERTDMWGEPIKVCGIHARPSSVITYTAR